MPRDPDHFEELFIKLERLLDAQHASLVENVDELGLGGPGQYSFWGRPQILTFAVNPRPPSFERRRPRGGDIPQPRPEPEPHPDFRGGRGNYRNPDIDDDFMRGANRPPPAPDIPGSPTTSNTFSTQSSNLNSALSSHWLQEVFNQSRPATLLEDTGQT